MYLPYIHYYTYTKEMTVPEQSIKWLTGTGTAGQLPDSAGTASDDDGVHRVMTYVSVPGSHNIDGTGTGTGAGAEGEDTGLWESFDALTTFGVKV